MNITLNTKTLAWVAGIMISVGVIWTGVATAIDKFVEFHDARWVTISGLVEIFNARDLKLLKQRIAEYEWIKNEGGGLTQKQKWELGQMYDQLEESVE